MFQRFKTRLQDIDGSIWFYLALLIISLLILRLTFNVHPDASGDFWGNVRVEFVGFCFDVLLLGLIFTIFMQRRQRKRDIKRWEEEIDDYRGWDEKEAMYRIVGNELVAEQIFDNECFRMALIFMLFNFHLPCQHIRPLHPDACCVP